MNTKTVTVVGITGTMGANVAGILVIPLADCEATGFLIIEYGGPFS